MANLKSNYAGITLQNPIVAGSSGLTNSVKKIEELVEAGASAVILKSLFEEQIVALTSSMEQDNSYPEAADYMAEYVRANEIGKYLELIQSVKKAVNVPVIASINCYKMGAWTEYAVQMAQAGADALELNIMRLESDLEINPNELFKEYFEIIHSIKKNVSIPIQVKISKYFSCIPALVEKLAQAGASGITLFNRSFQMDINIETESITSGDVYTSSADLSDTLRYTGIIARKVERLPISASTGVHSGKDLIKCLLAGASSVQMCSEIYQNGAERIRQSLEELEEWMKQKQYSSLSDLRGKLKAEENDSSQYTRMQFMKYFSNKK